MLQNTWFLIGCALFAVAALVSIIVGAVTHTATAIGIGVVVLVAAVVLFISGLVDRRHMPRGPRTAT